MLALKIIKEYNRYNVPHMQSNRLLKAALSCEIKQCNK